MNRQVILILMLLGLAIGTGISRSGQAAGPYLQTLPLISFDRTATSAYPKIGALTFGMTEWSATPRVNGDGSVVAITTVAALNDSDRNEEPDVYVWHRERGEWLWLTEGADQPSEAIQVSADGRYVLVRSWANTLAAGDRNGGADIFRYDLEMEQMQAVSVTTADVPGNGESVEANMSADGRWVVFSSSSRELHSATPPCDAEAPCNTIVYVRDMQNRYTYPVPIYPSNAVNLAIADGGQVVAFQVTESVGDNCLAPVMYQYDFRTGATTLIASSYLNSSELGIVNGLTVSADGRWAGYSMTQLKGTRRTDTLWLRSLYPDGPIYLIGLPITTPMAEPVVEGGCGGTIAPTLPELSLSADGMRVVFTQENSEGRRSTALYDRGSNGLVVVSRAGDGSAANGDSEGLVVSGNGQSVWFQSRADNLVPDDPNGNGMDIFVWDNYAVSGILPPPPDPSSSTLPGSDVLSGGGTLISLTGGTEFGGYAPKVSADGGTVLFSSFSSDVVENDTNGVSDVFVWERATGLFTRVSVKSDGTQSDNHSTGLAVSADGQYVLFLSLASFTSDDTDNDYDLYRHDRVTGKTQLVARSYMGQPLSGTSTAALSPNGQRVFFSEGPYQYGQRAFLYDFVTATLIPVTAPNGARIQAPAHFGFSADGQHLLYADKSAYCFGEEIYRQSAVDGGRTLLRHTDSGYRVGGDTVHSAMYYSPTLSTGGEGWLTGFYRYDAPGLTGRSGLWSVDDEGERVEVYAFEGSGCQNFQRTSAAQSEDGARVAFSAPDLFMALHPVIAADTNLVNDLYLYDRETNTYRLLSSTNATTPEYGADGLSTAPSISADGGVVVFVSTATNLVPGDLNQPNVDVFVWVEE